MSIDPGSPWRGAAAAYPQPMSDAEMLGVEALVAQVYYMNCGPGIDPERRLPDIIYRSSDDDHDIRRHVYRWDSTDYRVVFMNGFEAWRQGVTNDSTYFDLEDHIHHGGTPLATDRPVTHAFISTTLDSGWQPRPNLQQQSMSVYRYEINAPGGIWVSQTLGDRYRFPNQAEVAFIGAIAPQYIRSAQLFRITQPSGSIFQRVERADDTLILNTNFNPHPRVPLELRLPVVDYMDRNDGQRKKLKKLKIYPPSSAHAREKRQAVPDEIVDWYANHVEDAESYINAAFRARSTNEAYLFMKNEYVLVNYAPGSTNDRIINGPLLICDGFHSLVGTAFGEHGIDCAFDTDGTNAFIFCGKLCAYIDYAPGSTNDKILQGPMTIAAMFPFFKGKVFEDGIDAAFRATARNEAYLFKGDQYALINYDTKTQIAVRYIKDGFHSLAPTVFKDGIEAAFASHRSDEAYIFKGDQYALINFAPGTTNDYIIGGVKKIVDHWPSLSKILPQKNRGLDLHDHHVQNN